MATKKVAVGTGLTAYSAYVKEGGTLSYEEWTQEVVKAGIYAENAYQAELEAKAAKNAAEEAKTAAQTAQQTAESQATAAAASATASETSAQSSADSATTADSARDVAISAKDQAVAAKSGAEEALQSAEEAADRAEATAEHVDEVVPQIAQAGAAQITAIETKGAETRESIPDDYTALSDDVTNLKSALKNIANIAGDLGDLTTEDKSSLVAAINEAAVSGGGGLTDVVKDALLKIFTKVAYVDEHGQDYYDELYDALYSVTAVLLNSHSITLNALGATSQLTARTVPEGGRITWTSSNPAVATVDQTGLVTSVAYGNATITATSGTASDTCSVVISQVTLSGITAEYTPSGKVYDTDALDTLKTDLVITAAWSDGSLTVVPSVDYTLSGTLSTGSSVITASYGGKTASFTVTVVGLTSISATYTQSGTVYSDDSLDSLKPDLVVLKNYSDSSVQATTEYTLSGTLETGTSTITVTCAGFTDTFTVTVTASQALYRLPQETTFNGSSDYIDTGVQLYKTDIDYTMFLDVTTTRFSNNETILHCMHEANPYDGLIISIRGNNKDGGTGNRPAVITRSNTLSLIKTATASINLKIAVTHSSGDDHFDLCWLVDNILHKETVPFTFASIDETALLGAFQDTSGVKGRYFAGTIHSFVINSNVASQTELNTFFGNTAPVTGLSATYSSSITLRAGSHPEYWVKPGVTALAMHSNGIGECISDFTISNTPLTVGTNTLTVSKDNYSDTITVEAIADDATYRLPAPVTFNGTSDYIDTGVQLLATDHDFSLALSWDAPIQDNNSFRNIANCYDDGTLGYFKIRANRTNSFAAGLQDALIQHYVGSIGIQGISRMAVTYTSSSKVFKVTIYDDAADSIKTWTGTVSEFTTHADTLLLGCKDVGGTKSDFFNGTLKDVTVFDRALSDAEITLYCTKT